MHGRHEDLGYIRIVSAVQNYWVYHELGKPCILVNQINFLGIFTTIFESAVSSLLIRSVIHTRFLPCP